MKRYRTSDLDGKTRQSNNLDYVLKIATYAARNAFVARTWTIVDQETDERITVTESGTWFYARKAA